MVLMTTGPFIKSNLTLRASTNRSLSMLRATSYCSGIKEAIPILFMELCHIEGARRDRDRIERAFHGLYGSVTRQKRAVGHAKKAQMRHV